MKNPKIKMNTDFLSEGCIIVTSKTADTCPNKLLEPGIDPKWYVTKRGDKWFAITPTGTPKVEVEIVHLDDGVDGFVIADKEDLTTISEEFKNDK